LVIAPGAWAPGVLAELHLPLEVERQVQYWFEPVGGIEPFLPDRFPIFIWEDENDVVLYGFPALDGPTGGVKVAFHHRGSACTADTIDREIHAEEVAHMRTYLATHVPALDGTCLHAATCMYTNTPDQDFVIATHPAYPQVAIAAGFSGHGYKFAGVVGEILADLAAEGCTKQPIELFAPKRFS
jgi:sarcosine oxidase